MHGQNEIINVQNSETARSPGILGRFVLRNTPVPILVREFLGENERYEFTEDYNLPANFGGIPGLPEPQRTSFFLRERAVIRVGVVHRRAGVEPDEQGDLLFSSAIRDELLRCGKNAADFIVLPFASDDAQNRDVFRGRALASVIWLQEKTTLENLIGGGEKIELPPKLVIRASELLPDGNVVDYAGGESGSSMAPASRAPSMMTKDLVVPVASGEIAPSQSVPSPSTAGVMQAPPAVPGPEAENATPAVAEAGSQTQAPALAGAEQAPAAEISAPPAKTPPQWRDWSAFRYGVSGTSRGQLRRRMLIRHTGGFLRAIMLAAEKQPSAEYLARFFEEIGDAADPVRAHRAWLGRETDNNARGEFGEIASISFALNKDGRFISAGREIRPVLWRAAKRQLVVFPITRSADANGDENPYRLVRGSLNPGDRVLLTPGRFASHELRELFDIFKIDNDDEVRERLDSYLDYRARGKALLLTHAKAEPAAQA